MQEEIVKVCPACGSEFQMRMERCLDCGASLVVALPGADPRDAFEAHEEPAIPPDCVHLRTAAVGWIRRLSEDLDEAGIRHWATPPEWRRDPSLYVLPDDQEAALRVDRARYEVEVPGITAEDALPQAPVRPRRRDPADDLDVKLCPRCGGEYQLWAEVCADCGVALVRPWDFESARRQEAARAAVPAASVASDDPGACPACGERLREGEPECPGCGLTLAQPDACPNCGVELEPHVARCARCGEELFATPEG
jgi:predicted amidophosphoribosyltransferase